MCYGGGGGGKTRRRRDMIIVQDVYIQAGYSGRDHLAPRPEVTRREFRDRSQAMRYYYARYPGWALGFVYRRGRRGGGVETVTYAPRTDGHVHLGLYVEHRVT
jgi:hypothetical protein